MVWTGTPAAADALFQAFVGQPLDDGHEFTAANNKRADSKYTYTPIQNEILALIKSALALPADQKTYTCLAGLAVGDPVYSSAADTVALALADTAAHSRVIGFVAYKPTTTSCILRIFALKTGLAGLTVGNPVYLTDAGAISATAGTKVRPMGMAVSTTAAILFVSPQGLLALADVDPTALADGYTLAWNATTKRIEFVVNATTDEKVKAEGTDPTAGYLDAKVDNSSIEVDATGHALRVKAAGITLAMLANLDQDKFIGRVTASTGVPETATITAAARTVLDDTTVAAMLTTLGGEKRWTNTPTAISYDAVDHTDHNNTGAGGSITGTLPAATVGVKVRATIAVGQVMDLVRAGTDVIADPSDGSITKTHVSANTIGKVIELECKVTGIWFVNFTNGAWTIA